MYPLLSLPRLELDAQRSRAPLEMTGWFARHCSARVSVEVPYLGEQIPGRSWGVGRCNPGHSHFSESVRAAGRTLILSVIAVALLASRSTAVSPMREVRRVLIINDLGVISSPGFAEIDQAVLAGLQKSPYQIELYEESLDFTLFPDRVSQDRFRENIIQKYSASKPDVIIAAGPASLKFIAKLYDTFQGAPIIFCGVWGEIPDQLRHGMPFTGVLAQLHPEGTLNAALHLLPSTKHVVVIGGVGKFDEGFEAIAKQSFHNYESKLEFTYLFDLTMPALLERLKQLPNDTIVYHTAITQDAAGARFVDSAQSIPMVASAANAPVFVMDDVDLRAGTVGGDLVNWADDGRVAAEMAVRVLNGENPQNIPVVTSNHAYMFDWRALKRWGMNEKNLPPGSIVLNRQPTVWEAYKQYIILGIAVMFAEALLIFGLLWQRKRRKKSEVQLRESEERFRLVANTAPVMIWMAGTDKLCTYFNKPWLDFTGRSLEQELGNGWAEGVHPEDLRRCKTTYIQAFDRREAFRMQYRLRRHDGEFRLVLDIGVPRFNPDGSFAGYIGSCIDVTEQRRAEEHLRRAQEDLARVSRVVAIGELTAAIAHEVNQPLGAVVTNASASLRWLAGQPPNLGEAREAIDRTVREVTRASNVIRRIRALLQKGPPQMERLDLNAVIQEVLILASNELLRGGVVVQTDLAPDVPNVLGDRIQLQQVLLNVILNGVDAMSTITDRPRELLIKSAQHPDGVLIQVHDSGEGVDPEQADHIFEPFFTTKPQGIGMGLSVGRSIVEAHGGRLWFTHGSSHGVVFQFTVPKADASDERAA
ncbi:MAG: ABC transporter substrate binding protein [Candidatus Sulfotelmatobacter sp.]